jgi:uncharacterized protein (DUF983 family)
MDSTATLVVLGAASIVLAVAFWRDHRPRTDSLNVRWVPWRFIMLLAAAIILFCLVHLVNLGGLTTGQAGTRF